MDEVRAVVNLALAERATKEIKVKQPLASLKIKNLKSKIRNYSELLGLIKDEVNVKDIIFDDKIENAVELDTTLTEELEEEGTIREIIRQIQAERKDQNLVPQDRISMEIILPQKEKIIAEKNKDFLLKESRADKISIKEQGSEEKNRLIKIKRIE